MLVPIRTDCPLRSTPYMNYALILANVVMFALQKFSRAGGLPFDLDALRLDPGRPELLHFVTYAFLHGGWMHLISNMVFLYIFGNNVSDRLGQWGYLAFYVAGGVFAGVGFVLTATPIGNTGLYAPVVGASGAVAAVTGAYLVLFPRSNVTVFYFFILIGMAEIPGLWFVAFFFLQDVVLGLFGQSNVAHSAHISGSVFGFVVTLGLLWGRLLERHQIDVLSMISRWNRRREFKAAVASGWDPYAPKPGKKAAGAGGAGGPGLGLGWLKQRPEEETPSAVMELRAQVSEAMAHRNLGAAAELYLKLIATDAGQVLSRNAQLDIGNQLAEMGRYAEAAEAYEQFLKHYPSADQHAHIELLVGLIYARYLSDPLRAVARIEHAAPRLTLSRDIELAQAELVRLKQPASPMGPVS